MSQSAFHTSLSHFIHTHYPETASHPLEDPSFLQDCGLSANIYRPIPRVSFNDDLGVDVINPQFRNIPNLKKLLIDTALLSLYKHAPTKPKIILFTWVFWDGWGDYYAQLECAKLIKVRFPQANLHLVTCHLHDKKPYESFPNQTFVPFKKHEKPELPPSLVQQMQGADLVFQFPTYYPHTADLMKRLPPGVMNEFLGENGFIETKDYQPSSGRRSMGLSCFEKGILLVDPPPKQKVAPYYFAYTRTPEGLHQYLEALVGWKKNNLTIHAFNISHVIQAVQRGISGVKSVEIHFEEFVSGHTLCESGATLTFKVKHNVPHQEFLSLLNNSEDFVACTGDLSFGEAISCGKILYYDPPAHKKCFLQDLIALAQARAFQALTFFESPIAIRQPEVRESLYRLTDIIKKEHCVNDVIYHLINRALCHKTIPMLKEAESLILDQFARGEISAPEALHKLEKEIQKFDFRYKCCLNSHRIATGLEYSS